MNADLIRFPYFVCKFGFTSHVTLMKKPLKLQYHTVPCLRLSMSVFVQR